MDENGLDQNEGEMPVPHDPGRNLNAYECLNECVKILEAIGCEFAEFKNHSKCTYHTKPVVRGCGFCDDFERICWVLSPKGKVYAWK